ncbi:hypothetical protein ABT010_40895 [Streptomyces sp. NPDC002668]|uniref:hypothetical protein n=1 Tax=Streptomyces sp. NPDC002668 TaxID=3154422 RepID=UPI00332000D4
MTEVIQEQATQEEAVQQVVIQQNVIQETAPERVRPTTLEEYASGDESDLNVVLGWLGPAIDPETGGLAGPLPDTYIVAESNGWPKPEGEPVAAAINEVLLEDLWKRPGLLGAVFAVSEQNWHSGRALSIWTDEEALNGFLSSEGHRDAVRRMRDIAFEWEGIRWVSTSRELPTFDEVRVRLAAQRAARREAAREQDAAA